MQQCVRLVGGWDVAHCGEQLSSLAQRPVSTGCAEGDQAASLAEQRVRELRYVAKLAPPRGRLGVASGRSDMVTSSLRERGAARTERVLLQWGARLDAGDEPRSEPGVTQHARAADQLWQ